MFALESLGIADETCANSDRVRRACDFLVRHQMEDGGWGETYMVSYFDLFVGIRLNIVQSCVTGKYAQHNQSQVVQTAWAILALIYGQYDDKTVIERAAKLIMSRQLKDGRWEQEDTEGIFNKNCAIDYPGELTRNPIFALELIQLCSVQVRVLYLGVGKGGQIFEVIEMRDGRTEYKRPFRIYETSPVRSSLCTEDTCECKSDCY